MAEEKGDVRGGSQNEGDNQPPEGDENGYDTDEDFSDPEDFVDDITDEELLGDLLRQKPQEHDGIDSVIVVDHIPEIGADRLAKLQNVVTKIFSKFGKVITQHYPKDENEKTKGYAFLEYASPAHAKEAVKAANGYKLDKNHTFSVNLFSDFDKYTNIPDEWEPPKTQPFKDLGNLKHWLMDHDSYDQYSVIYEGGEKTAIMLNTRGGLPATVEERARWTETYVRWSPRGTYLTTFHGKGIALWGGEHFKQIMRFSHPGVQLIDFSPCERYIVTFSPMPSHSEEPQAIIFWDLRTGQRKRGFHSEAGGSGSWPIFKWSDDGKYFARLTTDTLSVYETPSFGLLDKKSMKVKSIVDFSWSPSDNVIAYWVSEDANVPARVVILEIPSRQELRIKNLFSVAECKMHWQKGGDYLCVKVDRYSKLLKKDEGVKYAGMYHNFDLFRMREKQIPVDSIECKETVIAFAWEPNGSRFAFVHGESPRINASFYVIRPGKVDLLKTLEKRVANHIFWSPMGQFVVLAGLRSMNGVLEFIDTTDITVMSQAEHFMATDVEWDPTGRYVSSAVSWWGHKMDNAYWIWNFQGKLLQKQPMERFCQLLWRPRPSSLLSEKHVKDIKKNMKKYSAQFELQDRMSSSKASKELIEKRRKILDEFNKYLGLLDQVFSSQKDERLELRDGVDTDQLESHVENFEDEVIEFLVKVDETIVEDSE